MVLMEQSNIDTL